MAGFIPDYLQVPLDNMDGSRTNIRPSLHSRAPMYPFRVSERHIGMPSFAVE
jgi:hypothetical protein